MDKFSYFRSYYEALKGLKAKARYAIREAIDVYMFEGKEPVFTDSLSKSMWSLLLPNLNKSKTYFDNRNGKTKENQTDNKTTSKAQQINIKSKTNQEQTHPIGKGIGKGIGEEKKEEKKTPGGVRSATASSPSRFKKPTVEEVRTFIQENNYHVNPNDFVNFYESKGWLVGKSPMKDWKAAVRTWESKEKNENPAKFVEEKDEFIPITPLERCQVCGSKNVATKGLYSMCNGCGVSYRWNNRWVEDN